MLRLGGDVIGGQLGGKAAQLGWDAEFMRDTVRGSTRDKALAKAVEQMQPYFKQCHNCGQWVCDQICWNNERGLCVTCAPKLDQAMAQMQAQAQVSQLNTKIQSQDWTKDLTTATRRPACARRAGRRAARGSSARIAVIRWPPRRRPRSSAGTAAPAEWRQVLRRVRHPG